MGYAYYTLPDGREAGYGVEAKCDREGCAKQIDRGLGYLCGNDPDGWRDDNAPGCGKYFCGEHEGDHDCPNPNGWDDDDDAHAPWHYTGRAVLGERSDISDEEEQG